MDAYAIRKMVPRIVIGVIAINLSIYFCVAMIDIFTIVGDGLGNLMTRPFVGTDSFDFVVGNGSTVQSVLGGVAGVGGLAVFAGIATLAFQGKNGAGTAGELARGGLESGAMWIIMFILIPIVLIGLAVLFTLVIRQGLLVFLTIVSPVAIALYILPGTEKYFRQWLDLFIKTLMVYPIIAAVFAMSDILSSIIFRANTGLAGIIVGIIVMVIPLLMIPFAFKLSGGVIGSIGGFATSRASGYSKRAQQGIAKSMENPTSLLGSRKFKRSQTLANARSGLYDRSVERGGRRGKLGKMIGGQYSANRVAALNRQQDEIIGAVAASGNDDYVRASTIDMDALRGDKRRHRTNKDGVEEFRAASGNWYTAEQIKAGKAQYGTPAGQQAALKHVMSKTENLTDEMQEDAYSDWINYANSAGLSKGEAIGGWAGISIPNQRMRQDLRYAGIDGEKGSFRASRNHANLLDSIGTQQGYAMASQAPGTFDQFAESYAAEHAKLQTLTATAADTSLKDEVRAEAATERDLTAQRLQNAKGNLQKFVGSTRALSAAEIAQREAAEKAGEEGSAGGSAVGYGGASSASWKSEQAAIRALDAINGLDPPPPGPGGPGSGGSSGGSGASGGTSGGTGGGTGGGSGGPAPRPPSDGGGSSTSTTGARVTYTTPPANSGSSGTISLRGPNATNTGSSSGDVNVTNIHDGPYGDGTVRNGQKFSETKRIVYSDGAEHFYGVDAVTGKLEHTKADEIIKAYGYDPADKPVRPGEEISPNKPDGSGDK